MKAEEEQNDDGVIMKRGGGTEEDGPVVGAMSVRVLRLLCCGHNAGLPVQTDSFYLKVERTGLTVVPLTSTVRPVFIRPVLKCLCGRGHRLMMG